MGIKPHRDQLDLARQRHLAAVRVAAAAGLPADELAADLGAFVRAAEFLIGTHHAAARRLEDVQ